jgi:hypothetical protein
MAGATAYNGPRVECSMHRMGSLMMLLCVLRFHDDLTHLLARAPARAPLVSRRAAAAALCFIC